jgi:hypothetical protein
VLALFFCADLRLDLTAMQPRKGSLTVYQKA